MTKMASVRAKMRIHDTEEGNRGVPRRYSVPQLLCRSSFRNGSRAVPLSRDAFFQSNGPRSNRGAGKRVLRPIRCRQSAVKSVLAGTSVQILTPFPVKNDSDAGDNTNGTVAVFLFILHETRCNYSWLSSLLFSDTPLHSLPFSGS